ncbi:hypothetical protein GGQ87_002783 [Brevundimonas alba]|uniref:Uncharacterized protein n=1 Tax=Brevundimonas alba TaxID=74314 RepID=A0A7X6BNS5_9CAUL|nr:hypothetical protein [Brevundimonas alba]NJC42488.1 hypothetical protein [Brevundimonas alba]
MDEQELIKAKRARSRKFYGGLALVVIGLAAVATGGAFADQSGEAGTGAGFAVGLGAAFVLGGALVAWGARPGDTRWMLEASQTRRDRLQGQRARQLFLFPAVALLFAALAVEPVNRIVSGDQTFRDYLAVLLPVLYAWLTAAIAMGWDSQSRHNRQFLEDELTIVIRARAMTMAFLVLMVGTTVALGFALARPESGAVALMFALAAAGVTAGVRFAWLDREAGQDG